MAGALRLLIIEDVEDHALLIVRELQKGGFDTSFERVETVQELEEALARGPWDAVISDFNLPGFDGIQALRMMQEKGLDLPFLLVSGAIGEEKAAEVMKAGAHDYIRKGNLARLVPTLERELRDAKMRQERRQTAEELSRYREHLEELVQERTAELTKVNQALQVEKQEREQVLLQLEAVLDSIREGVVISDLEQNVLMMNREALALHEYRDVEEVRRPAGYFPQLFELYHLNGETVPFEQWPLPRAARGERFAEYELEVRRRDTGKRAIVSYSGTRVYSREGEPLLAVITLHDITERKRAEEALRKSEYKFSKVFNAAPSLIGITTLREGKIVDINESALQTLGYGKEEVAGRTLQEIQLWVDESRITEVLQTLEQGGAVRNYEIRFQGKSGTVRTGLLSADVITLDEEQYMLALVRDITERKQAEQEVERLNAALAARVAELEEMNQELDAFNRMVSHDLRQPLNTMSLCCQEVEMLGGGDEVSERALETIGNGILRMNTLIETLLKFSRSTHAELQREEFDISELASAVIDEMRLAEPGRRVVVRVTAGLMANADPRLLRAVLENLIGNAWKYTEKREEAVIEFGAIEIDGREAFFVRDNGRGFDMADAGKLFTPFQRLPGTGSYKGSGIGLATVQRIIRRHGGRIWAEGEPDRGATFYFTLHSPPA